MAKETKSQFEVLADTQIVINSMEKDGTFSRNELEDINYARFDLLDEAAKIKKSAIIKNRMIVKLSLRKAILDKYIKVLSDLCQ